MLPERSNGFAESLYTTYLHVIKTERQVGAALEKATRQQGLALTDALLILVCHQSSSGTSQRQLAKELAISPAQISGRLEALRKRRLLISRRSECDRRKQLWTLTEQSQRVVDRLLLSIEQSIGTRQLSAFEFLGERALAFATRPRQDYGRRVA